MAQPLARIHDHAEQALSDLAGQFIDSTQLRGVLRAAAERIQTLEDIAQDMLLQRTIDNAVGAQLDVIGQLVGQLRLGGEGDALYRVKLRAAMLRNKSQGDADQVIAVALVVASSSSASLWTSYPAGIGLSVLVASALSADEQTALQEFVLATKAGAIELVGLAYHTSKVFGFSEDPDPDVGTLDDGTNLAGAGTLAAFFYP